MTEKAAVQEKNGRKWVAWLLLALAMCFMVCLFSPLETFFLNREDFWFGLNELLPYTLTVFLVCFLAAWVVFLIFFKTRIFRVVFTFGFFVFLGLYVQGNYIPRPYGLFDGRAVDWSSPDYSGLAIASIAVLAAVLLLTVLSSIFIKKKIYTIASFVCGVILLSQVATLTILGVRNTSGDSDAGYGAVITTEGVFDLSASGRNIVVFLFDTFEGGTMSELIETDFGRAACTEMTGFTFYPDMVGSYTNTTAALPYILEGAWYTNETTLPVFVQAAYDEKPLMYRALKEKDYSVGVYTYSDSYLSRNIDDYINLKSSQYVIKNKRDHIMNIMKMSLFKYAPHQLKSLFVVDTGDFVKVRAAEGAGLEAYRSDVPEFYSDYKTKGLRFTDEQNSFRFYYTDGVHQSYTFDEEIKPGKGLTCNDEAKGCLHLLCEYIEELKENGKYDDTAIVVLADHSDGWRSLKGSNPLFMIKGFGEDHAFAVSDAAVSFEDLQETFASLALDEILPGSIWSDEIKDRTERRYLYYQPQGGMKVAGFLPTIWEYSVKGFAGDPDSMVPTGMIYEPKNAYYDIHYFAYPLGEKLPFDPNPNSAKKYIDYGISIPSRNGADSRDAEGQLRLDVGPDCGNLLFTVDFKDYFANTSHRLLLTVNGTPFGEIHSGETVRIDGGLIGEDGILLLHFDYPDATTEASQGDSSKTYLRSVVFQSLLLEQAG